VLCVVFVFCVVLLCVFCLFCVLCVCFLCFVCFVCFVFVVFVGVFCVFCLYCCWCFVFVFFMMDSYDSCADLTHNKLVNRLFEKIAQNKPRLLERRWGSYSRICFRTYTDSLRDIILTMNSLKEISISFWICSGAFWRGVLILDPFSHGR
jgi:hypothetical protein